MAEVNPAPKKKFQMVTATHKVSGGALRDDPAITIYPSGRAVCNRGGTDIMDEVASTTVESYLVKFGADPKTKTVAVYLADSQDTGAMRIRRYQNSGGTRISFHMGGVWKEHPKLRPSSATEYLVTRNTDEDGIPYMEIGMSAGLEARKGRTTDAAVETTKTADPSKASKKSRKQSTQAKETTDPATETNQSTDPAHQTDKMAASDQGDPENNS